MSTSSKWPQPVQAFEYPAVLTNGRTAPARKSDEDAALEAQAREQMLRELEAHWQKECERRVAEERAQLKQAIDGFAGDCDQYYRRVEAEVVQLSLAVARRILHREAETDPLMLAGVVRVALDNLRDATDLKLHVCPTHAQAWRELFKKSSGRYQLTVLDEPLFEPSQVRLES